MKYYIDPKIDWKTFKKVNDKFQTGGIFPKEMDRMLWELLKDRRLNIFIDDKKSSEEAVCITTKNMPKKGKILRASLTDKKV